MENQMKKSKKNADLLQKDLPDDLLPEILCKLPARSICRFRCVCKCWRDLFQNEKFISRTRSDPPFEFEIEENGVLKYYMIDKRGSAIAKSKNYYIGGLQYRRCNNLICYQPDSDTRNLSVLDLSTQHTYLLPPPTSELDLALALELEQRCFNFEFGLDPFSNEYKVLVWTHGTSRRNFYILTLQGDGRRISSSWRRPLGVQISDFYSSSYEKSFATTTGMIYLVDGPKLISFNLSTEEFGMVLLPSQVIQRRIMVDDQSHFWYSLFEYEGCLCWVEQSEKSLIEFPEFKYWEITGMWMLKSNIWVRLMKETSLPVSMDASSVSTTWSQKHSQISSTPSGEIMITISTDEFGDSCDPFLLLYSFLNQEFYEISISYEDDSDKSFEDDSNDSCIELL